MAEPTESINLSTRRTFYIVAFNVILILLMSLKLYNVIMSAAKAEEMAVEQAAKVAKTDPAAKTGGASTANTPDTTGKAGTAPKPDSNATSTENVQKDETASLEAAPAHARTSDMIAYVLWAISLAGGLGGALANMRGFFEHYRDKSYFPSYLEIPFYLRPISGILCGLFTFFLSTFFAGALAAGGDGSGWKTMEGMFPYIGIAFIAGFASQEFMERLKETAKTLFGVPTTNTVVEPPATEPPATEPPATEPAAETPPIQTGGEENFVEDQDGISSKGAIKTIQAPPPPVIVPPPTVRNAPPPPNSGRRGD
jgi:hypothetical protein